MSAHVPAGHYNSTVITMITLCASLSQTGTINTQAIRPIIWHSSLLRPAQWPLMWTVWQSGIRLLFPNHVFNQLVFLVVEKLGIWNDYTVSSWHQQSSNYCAEMIYPRAIMGNVSSAVQHLSFLLKWKPH